jgi:hypothetical protein
LQSYPKQRNSKDRWQYPHLISLTSLFLRVVHLPSSKQINGVVEVVSGEQKDQRFYWVTPANPSLQLVDGVPTFMFYTNTPKELEDREESDEDGNPLYVKDLG